MKGTLKSWDSSGGFGKIRCDDGHECFVHVSELADGTVAMRPGMRVELTLFNDGRADGMLSATNVSPTGKDAASSQVGAHRGTVTRMFPDKGYAFIRPEGGAAKDYFFRLEPELRDAGIAGGQLVTFELKQDRQGRPMATRVRRIAPESSA